MDVGRSRCSARWPRKYRLNSLFDGKYFSLIHGVSVLWPLGCFAVRASDYVMLLLFIPFFLLFFRRLYRRLARSLSRSSPNFATCYTGTMISVRNFGAHPHPPQEDSAAIKHQHLGKFMTSISGKRHRKLRSFPHIRIKFSELWSTNGEGKDRSFDLPNERGHHAGHCHALYSVNPKNPPEIFWNFFPKWLGMFRSNSTHLLYVPIYTGLQIFI